MPTLWTGGAPVAGDPKPGESAEGGRETGGFWQSPSFGELLRNTTGDVRPPRFQGLHLSSLPVVAWGST